MKSGLEYLVVLENGILKFKDRTIDFSKVHLQIERSENEQLGFKLTFNGITNQKFKFKAAS